MNIFCRFGPKSSIPGGAIMGDHLMEGVISPNAFLIPRAFCSGCPRTRGLRGTSPTTGTQHTKSSPWVIAVRGGGWVVCG